jgi:hypothetical protein
MSFSAPRIAWPGFGRRRVGQREMVDDLRAAGGDSVVTRATLRRYLPDVALYVTSALLACVVGASIALYLN